MKILSYCWLQDIKGEMRRWYKALRALFSDDVLTMRNVLDTARAYRDKSEHRLAAILHDKLPTIVRDILRLTTKGTDA